MSLQCLTHQTLLTRILRCVPMQSKVMGCDNCRDLFTTLGSLQASSPGRDKTYGEPSDEEKDGLKEQLRHLELELAQTKLQLVEAKCRIQVSSTGRHSHVKNDNNRCTDAGQCTAGWELQQVDQIHFKVASQRK